MNGWQGYAGRHGYAGLIAGLALGCAPEAKSPRERLPENIVVRVDRVGVAATQPGTEQRWDADVPEPRGNAVCSLLAIGTNLVSPVAGDGVEGLCGSFVRVEERGRFPHDPDLRLRLDAGAAVSFESPVALNVTSHTFSYEFVVPTSAVPADGIRIEVLDDDAGDGGQSIGAVRLTLETLATTFESSTRMYATAEGAIHRLEVVVSPYLPMDIEKQRYRASREPHPIGTRRLMAGEIVHLRSEGSYKVGDWYDKPIGPTGYTGDAARRYNFKQEPFASAPHAAGIALTGRDGAFQGALVAPCITFTTLYAGDLRVGINDTEPKNNEGWIEFGGYTRAPTVEEWGRRISAECR